MQVEIYEQMAHLEKKHFWFKARREVLAVCLHRLLPEGQPVHPLILDAGCGTGGNLDVLSHFGTSFGVDNSQVACCFAPPKWRERLVQGDLTQLPMLSDIFNVVSLLDVLEHIHDQQKVLSEIRRILKPGGALLLTVPAYMHLWSSHDTVHKHQRRYRKDELLKELVNAGFKVNYVSYYNTYLYPLVGLVRLIKKIMGMEEKSDLQMPAKWVNQLLYRIFRLERHWIGKIHMPFGVSLVAVAFKQK